MVYCKCKKFKPHPSELLRQQPWRKSTCKKCGARKPEWRCPVHKLLAEPLEGGDSAGCPRCGRAPKEQFHDSYMSKKARMESIFPRR